jgi:hypothetical protein
VRSPAGAPGAARSYVCGRQKRGAASGTSGEATGATELRGAGDARGRGERGSIAGECCLMGGDGA